MNDELKIRAILSRIDALHREVEELLPKSEPFPAPEPVAVPEPKPESEPQPRVEPTSCEPSAAELFWAKVEDWICVRGDFAPKGVTREFAVATRWLTRIGALLLVGAMAYFLMLAINRGLIGPTQRVLGMMFWGFAGTAQATSRTVCDSR